MEKILSTAGTRGGIAERITSHGLQAKCLATSSINPKLAEVATGTTDKTLEILFSSPALSGSATLVTTIPSVSRLPKGTCTLTPICTKALNFSGTW